jgi:hypothetical protein
MKNGPKADAIKIFKIRHYEDDIINLKAEEIDNVFWKMLGHRG